MIKQVRFRNYKGFDSFVVPLRPMSLLVGANNAGKTTIIDTLKSTALMIRHTRRRNPAVRELTSGHVWAYDFDPEAFDIEEVNIRHEFRKAESWFEVDFDQSPGVRLRAVWPKEEEGSPYFFIQREDKWQPTNTGQATGLVPGIGVIPVLTPVDVAEPLVEPKTIRRNFHGRLSSRHYRNQLSLMTGEDLPGGKRDQSFGEFRDFASEWIPELTLEPPRLDLGASAFDLYCLEEGRRPKEISWLGDGTQVWLQILLHVYVLQGVSTLVLDEPDIYLHSDWQRKLLRLLESLKGQTILATHSPEMVAEASPNAVIWIERSRPRAVLSPESDELASLYEALGSQLNVRLARALRDRVAVFVEGHDMAIIRNMAATVGATRLSQELGITVLPLGGFQNWRRLEGFQWIAKELLGEPVLGYVILDSDYYTQETKDDILTQLRSLGLHAHIWERKELESYLLDADAISRISGADSDWIRETLFEESAEFEHGVFANLASEKEKSRTNRRIDPSTILKETSKTFGKMWGEERRIYRVPAKDLLSALNRRLQSEDFRTITSRVISVELTGTEIPDEVTRLLLRIEEDLIDRDSAMRARR